MRRQNEKTQICRRKNLANFFTSSSIISFGSGANGTSPLSAIGILSFFNSRSRKPKCYKSNSSQVNTGCEYLHNQDERQKTEKLQIKKGTWVGENYLTNKLN